MLTRMPTLIGFVGNPHSGKTTAAEIFRNYFDYTIADDGYALRDFAVANLGLTWNQVMTQEGKAEVVKLLGREWTVREILGQYGKQLEDLFGPYIMPHMAMRRFSPGKSYVLPSVRKLQGHYIRERGGLVIEIVNPLAGPSEYEFDKYDKSAIDISISNDAMAKGLIGSEAVLHFKIEIEKALKAFYTKAA